MIPLRYVVNTHYSQCTCHVHLVLCCSCVCVCVCVCVPRCVCGVLFCTRMHISAPDTGFKCRGLGAWGLIDVIVMYEVPPRIFAVDSPLPVVPGGQLPSAFAAITSSETTRGSHWARHGQTALSQQYECLGLQMWWRRRKATMTKKILCTPG